MTSEPYSNSIGTSNSSPWLSSCSLLWSSSLYLKWGWRQFLAVTVGSDVVVGILLQWPQHNSICKHPVDLYLLLCLMPLSKFLLLHSHFALLILCWMWCIGKWSKLIVISEFGFWYWWWEMSVVYLLYMWGRWNWVIWGVGLKTEAVWAETESKTIGCTYGKH